MATLESAQPATIVIRPTHGPIPPRIGELWAYRELFVFLVWRDIKVRYAQTVLGAIWTVFQPLAMMGVYTYAFTQLARINTAPIPYALYALSGLALWTFVSRGVFQGTNSLVSEIALVTKTPSPRILIPMAGVTSMLVDFVITLILFLVFDGIYGRVPSWQFVFVVPLLGLAFVLTFGISLLLSAANVRYRDIGQALPFTIQLWFFLSPVAFPLLTPGHSWETYIQALNPLVGLILAFRWSLLGTAPPHGLFVVALIMTAVIFFVGVSYFSRADRTIADDV
ncbi:MAG TPA: ABC transporter permease [Gaiellaceae bacterium]|nr:ABC transporter permease [Gaiellaceae bacterium]